jgi:hypothetical protein
LQGVGRVAARQDGLLVIVVAGEVDGEALTGGGSDVAESAKRQGRAAGELAGDVGELAVVADGDAGELGPALACPGGRALAQRGLGRLRKGQDQLAEKYKTKHLNSGRLPGLVVETALPIAEGGRKPASARRLWEAIRTGHSEVETPIGESLGAGGAAPSRKDRRRGAMRSASKSRWNRSLAALAAIARVGSQSSRLINVAAA